MKTTDGYKIIFGVALLGLPGVLAAQNDPGNMPPASPGMAGPVLPGSAANQMTPGISRSTRNAGDLSLNNESGGPDAQTMHDKIFLRKSAQGGLAEVQLGQLAAKKASSEDVRKLGQKMASDRAVMSGSLKPFADTLGVMPAKTPGKSDVQEYEKLSALSGTDFDKEYLAYTSADHHRDLREFREEAAGASDQSLKDAVLKARMVIAEHTRMVDKLAMENGVLVGKPKP